MTRDTTRNRARSTTGAQLAWAVIALLIGCTATAGLRATTFSQSPDAWPPTTRGWLILAAARASHSATPCGALSAFSLETGAAFVHDGCTDRAWAGSVKAEAVQETLRTLTSGRSGSAAAEEGPVAHIWRWVVSSEHSLIGDWRRPPGVGVTSDPLERLLDDVGRLRRDACAPPLPPPSQVLAATLPAMITPVSADESQEVTVRYREARARWSALRPCAP